MPKLGAGQSREGPPAPTGKSPSHAEAPLRLQKPLGFSMRAYGLGEGLLAKDASQDYRYDRLCTVNIKFALLYSAKGLPAIRRPKRETQQGNKRLPWLERNCYRVTKNGP